MGASFVRNLRTAMRVGAEIKAVDKAAEKGIAEADYREREEVQIMGGGRVSEGAAAGEAAARREEGRRARSPCRCSLRPVAGGARGAAGAIPATRSRGPASSSTA